MIVVHRRVGAELPPGSCQLLLQIHDELLFEVDQRMVAQVKALCRFICIPLCFLFGLK